MRPLTTRLEMPSLLNYSFHFKYSTSRAEIADLLSVVDRELADASIVALKCGAIQQACMWATGIMRTQIGNDCVARLRHRVEILEKICGDCLEVTVVVTPRIDERKEVAARSLGADKC
jgi:hypothetical protein